jgi:short-subunit dehydrogenase
MNVKNKCITLAPKIYMLSMDSYSKDADRYRMKRAIVVGASSGIGEELARLLAANQYLVGITGKRLWLLQALKAERPWSYVAAEMDITDPAATLTSLELLIDKLGGLDLLVICSATGEVNYLLDPAIEARAISANVSGFTFVADWAFSYFQSKGKGHLVGITSITGLRGALGSPAFQATKAYQLSYLEGLRQKAKDLKLSVHITDVQSGYTRNRKLTGDQLFWGEPVEKSVLQIFKAISKFKSVCYIPRRW